MNNNLIYKIERVGMEGIDIEEALEYEQSLADEVYSEIKENRKKKEELQARYNSLKMAADAERINVDNIYHDRDMKEAITINKMGYTSLPGKGGKNIPISDVSDARLGKVFRDCYYKGKTN